MGWSCVVNHCKMKFSLNPEKSHDRGCESPILFKTKTYLFPRSIYSWMPKPKFPLSEKFSFLNLYSLTLKPRSKISSA